jgi:hypothetical protein
MNKKTLLIVSLVLTLLVTSWSPTGVTTSWASGLDSPALASTPIALTITNPLPKAVTITLQGKKSYTIMVPQGGTVTKTIEAGKYKYSYQGCLNKPKKGNLKVKRALATLKISPCKMATWSFYNADKYQPYTLRLDGWVDYNITVGPGQVLRFSFVADTYTATSRACGKTYNYTWKVKGKKAWIIFACK